uniref:hypothetical protein n=1 Tax=Gelidibacter sp. TaxID=2018083 RepID=UPI00404BA176
MNNVLVFKTSVSNKTHIKTVQPLLNKLVAQQDYWNFDLEDCDNILRVETQVIRASSICRALENHGFSCEELL